MMHWEERTVVVTYCEVYLSTCIEELKLTTKRNLSQGNRYPDRDSNSVLPKWDTILLITTSGRPVDVLVYGSHGVTPLSRIPRFKSQSR